MGEIKYILEYKNTGWCSRMAESSAKKLISSMMDFYQDKHAFGLFVDAMDACCNEFYREKERKDRPWYAHTKYHDSIARYPLSTDMLRKRLKKRATEPWTIDWYWKALITQLPEYKSPDFPATKIIVQLSQVRRWVLLTVYYMEGSKKKLLRPPMFGRSSRISDWDQYWLYLSRADEIAKHWENIINKDPLEKAYLLGRHDVVYTLRKRQIKEKDKKIEVTIKGDLELNPNDPAPLGLQGIGKISTQVCRVCRKASIPAPTAPHDLVVLPTFSNRGEREKKAKHEISILLASDSVCKAFEKISDVWNDITVESVHINAPPGSGKEVLSESIYWLRKFDYGQDKQAERQIKKTHGKDKKHKKQKVNNIETNKGFLEIVALSPHSPDRNESTLFGYSTECEGLVDKARGGCLVLDEIDKVQDASRTPLLRLLESKQYMRPGTSTREMLEKENRLLYIFLSSKPIEEVYAMEPIDLWTRVQLTIQVDNPFTTGDDKEKQRILQQYFHLFWNKQIPAFYENKYQSARDIIPEYFKKVICFLFCPNLVNFVSEVFAKECSMRYRKISVRNVRTIANRCFFNFVQRLVYSEHQRIQVGLKQEKDVRNAWQKIETFIFNAEYDKLDTIPEIRSEIERVVQSSMSGQSDYAS